MSIAEFTWLTPVAMFIDCLDSLIPYAVFYPPYLVNDIRMPF